MPLIQVNQVIGKTVEEKAELIRELTETYVRVTGAKPESVWVTIDETSKDNWGVGGQTIAARTAK